ncbi:MAG: rhodanese [Wenzhouxiangella sp.]
MSDSAKDASASASSRLWLLPLLIVVGVGIGAVQPWGVDELLAFGRDLASNPWFLAVVVLTMIVLFSFGLPGSLGFWLIAPFQTPVVGTVLLLIGSVGGAFGAYRFSSRLRGDWEPEGFSSRIVRLLSRQGGVLTQTALRILPGFPHSVVNFAGGVLGLGLAGFLLAATIGLAIKWAVYASAVHGLVEAVEAGDALDFRTLLPLVVLSLLLMVGALAKRWVAARSD